jgi:DNA polymerase-3 subunit gamma/tau
VTYQVLARKLRPQNFDEVIGQKSINESLKNALLSSRIGHAYLFCGTRGIGKTTVARIFAKALRCEKLSPSGNPCLVCPACADLKNEQSVDVLEIDGASHNGVENVRQLIDNVQYLPSSGKYKIYIIDEVHMLSTSAFNALLKTLEEPPPHVIFIFATTDPQKLPATILSRCQKFEFKNAKAQEIKDLLIKVIGDENIKISGSDTLDYIVKAANGSFRDALSLLEQIMTLANQQEVTEESVLNILGNSNAKNIKLLVEAILSCQPNAVRQHYAEIFSRSINVASVVRDVLDVMYFLITNYSNQLVQERIGHVKKMASLAELFWINDNLVSDSKIALESIDPEKIFEVAILKITYRREFLNQQSLISTTESLEKAPPEIVKKINETEKKPEKLKTWDEFLIYMRTHYPVLGSNLEQGNLLSNLIIEPQKIIIHLGFKESSKVFLEYLKDKTVYEKLLTATEKYFERPRSNIQLEIELLLNKEDRSVNFQSKVEVETEKKEASLKKKTEDFLNSDIVKQAESLFSSKVDKVIIESHK